MGNIYSTPEALPVPAFDDLDTYEERVEQYHNELREWCIKHGKGKDRGKVARFPFADGHASYYIVSLRPLKLIHDATGDAWHFPYIERLTAMDIRENAEVNSRIGELYAKKSGT